MLMPSTILMDGEERLLGFFKKYIIVGSCCSLTSEN
jgi:hypothetical protein